MDHSSRTLGDSSTESNDYGGLTQEGSERNNITDWARDHYCDILAKKR